MEKPSKESLIFSKNTKLTKNLVASEAAIKKKNKRRKISFDDKEDTINGSEWSINTKRHNGDNESYRNDDISLSNKIVSPSSRYKESKKDSTTPNGKCKKGSAKRKLEDSERKNEFLEEKIDDDSGLTDSKKLCLTIDGHFEEERLKKKSMEKDGNSEDGIKCNNKQKEISERTEKSNVTESVELKVGPSQRSYHSLFHRSRGRKRHSQGHSSSYPNSPVTSKSPTNMEKPPAYQKIDKDCYVALDCEMVGVGVGGFRSVLGRCSIVNYNGTVLYDKYVRSVEPVTDFRTAYSGITSQHMETAEPWEEAKQQIHKCLKNKVIIVHDARYDFKVLHFNPHRCLVRDTSRSHMLCGLARQNGHQGQANGLIPLKSMVKTILGKDIQMGTNGHDSVEDARAAMELFRRVRNGWEKILFAKWYGEGLNITEMVNGLNNKEDLYDRDGLRITDFRSESVVADVESGQNGFKSDYLSDDFWTSVI